MADADLERWRPIGEAWFTDGGEAAADMLAAARDVPTELWFESSDGRLLGVISNGWRALVVLLDGPGDAGVHAVDPTATDERIGGFLLANGQVDSYAENGTVPVALAIRCVEDLVRTGRTPTDVHWKDDRS